MKNYEYEKCAALLVIVFFSITVSLFITVIGKNIGLFEIYNSLLVYTFCILNGFLILVFIIYSSWVLYKEITT